MPLTTPLPRPFRWSRPVLTCLLPAIIQLAVLLDGIVSRLRTHTPDGPIALAKHGEGADYSREAGDAGELRSR